MKNLIEFSIKHPQMIKGGIDIATVADVSIIAKRKGSLIAPSVIMKLSSRKE